MYEIGDTIKLNGRLWVVIGSNDNRVDVREVEDYKMVVKIFYNSCAEQYEERTFTIESLHKYMSERPGCVFYIDDVYGAVIELNFMA